MHLHEFQTKTILKEYGIPIPDFFAISSVDEVDNALEMLDVTQAVVKVQVHAGGRGKAGGIKLARNTNEIKSVVKELLGKRFINNQTGPEGIVVSKVIISPIIDIKKEYYLAATIDFKSARSILIASSEGGVDIEQVAFQNPDKILTIPLEEDGSIHHFHFIRLAKFYGWNLKESGPAEKLIQSFAKAFVETDALLLEINPLVKTGLGDLVALDAKLTVDDNALFRQKHLASFYDATQLQEQEAIAKEHDLSYVSMNGNIGCMVNGAGLAMATMDIIKYYGGEPANFLDVGGGASEEKIAAGFKIILKDPKVNAILVNIFGGIMNCETIAKGIISAMKDLKLPVPLIVRLEGTNVDLGKKLLKDSGLNIITAHNLGEAAKKSVEAVKLGSRGN